VTSIFRQSTFRLAGSCSRALLTAVLVCLSSVASAEEITWPEFKGQILTNMEKDRKEGLSYIISGSLGLVGGLLAQSATSDSLEKGVFVISQSIGLAAIGVGANKWILGDEQRMVYESIRDVKSLSDQQRTDIIRSYFDRKRERQLREGRIKGITFAVIAALNFYGGTQTNNDAVKNSLYLIGTVNSLAALTYSFP
jgi:hypothetical protein